MGSKSLNFLIKSPPFKKNYNFEFFEWGTLVQKVWIFWIITPIQKISKFLNFLNRGPSFKKPCIVLNGGLDSKNCKLFEFFEWGPLFQKVWIFWIITPIQKNSNFLNFLNGEFKNSNNSKKNTCFKESGSSVLLTLKAPLGNYSLPYGPNAKGRLSISTL